LINFICNHCALDKDKILEVGGGSGAFLVLKNTCIERAYNVELVFKTYKNQANKRICLIRGDALNLPFADCTFEWVVIKNLLHHLVGRTRRQSRENVAQAVEELIRVTKDGGHIIIFELYNRYIFFSFVIFYLTMFFSRFFDFELFGLGKNVIVSFLTPDEIKENLARNNIDIILKNERKISAPKKHIYRLLMPNEGYMLIISRIHKIRNGSLVKN